MDCNQKVRHYLLLSSKETKHDCELMQSEKALYEIERCITNLYDWADLRKAKRDVLCWQARCDRAQSALKRCLASERN